MSDQDKNLLEQMIKNQFESMGMAVLSIRSFAPGTFKLEIIDEHGPRETLVTVMLHMVPLKYALDKRQ